MFSKHEKGTAPFVSHHMLAGRCVEMTLVCRRVTIPRVSRAAGTAKTSNV